MERCLDTIPYRDQSSFLMASFFFFENTIPLLSRRRLRSVDRLMVEASLLSDIQQQQRRVCMIFSPLIMAVVMVLLMLLVVLAILDVCCEPCFSFVLFLFSKAVWKSSSLKSWPGYVERNTLPSGRHPLLASFFFVFYKDGQLCDVTDKMGGVIRGLEK